MDPTEEHDAGCFDVIFSCFRTKDKNPNTNETEPLLGHDQGEATQGSPVDEIQANALNAPDQSAPSTPLHGGDLETTAGEHVDLCSEALKKSSQETQDWIGSLPTEETDQDRAKDLTDLVRGVEAQHKNTSTKVTIGEHDVLWRDYAKRTVCVLAIIGDIGARVIPPTAPFWIGIKALFDTSVRQSEDLVAIFGSADIVLRHVRLGRVYEVVYLDGSYEVIGPKSIGHLRNEIVRLYVSCLELLAYATRAMNESSWRSLLVVLIQSQKSNSMLGKLFKCADDVEKAAHTCQAETNRVISESHQRLLQSLHEPLRVVRDNMDKLLEHIQDSEIANAMSGISSIPVGTMQIEHQETRTDKTCDWLLKDPKFLRWENSGCSSLLWLHGRVGVRKTFLASKQSTGTGLPELSSNMMKGSRFSTVAAYTLR